MAEDSNTRVASCAQCGAPFEQRSGRGRPKKFCSSQCRERRHAKPYQRMEQPLVPCLHCKRMFKRFDARNVLCSNACKVAEWKLRRGRRTRSGLVRDEVAALKRIARRSPKAERRIRAIQLRAADIKRRRSHTCADCGVALDGDNLKKQFCEGCARARAKAHKRAARAAGKARLRTATVETFDPLDVLRRDGWRCHICGIKAPKRLRGTYADNAPELDHVVPLAAGGEHSRRNTACACRKCNIEKADRPLGQLRLVA